MKVTFEIDLSQLDPSRLAEVQHALSLLLGIGDLPKSQTAAPRPAEPAKPVQAKPVNSPGKTAQAKPAKVETVAEIEAKPSAEEQSATLDDIRSIMREKVNDYRNEIRAELKRLGAAKVTALAEEHYTAFHGFLMQLGEPPF